MAQSKKSSEITSLAKQLQKPESKVILDEMSTMAESEEYKRSAPPETQGQLTSAIQAAKELYQQEATKNDWLDVAQTLAGAVAQLGAAQQAGDKYTSRPVISANTDWAGRTARAQRDYLESVRQAEQSAESTRRGWQDTEAMKKADYAQQYQPLSERLRNAQQIESDASREAREAAREGKREAKEQERSDLQERKFQDQDLAKQEQEIKKQETAALTIANQLVNDPDMKNADRAKIQAKYGAVAAQAGIDPQVLADIGEQAKDQGLLGMGIFRKEDKEKKAQLIQEQVLTPIRTQLDAIRQKRESLRRVGNPTAAGQEAQAPVQSQQKAPQTVRIQAPDGTIAEVPAEKAQKYIAKGGKVVP